MGSKAQRLRDELELAEAEEAMVAAKGKRKVCEECGRPVHNAKTEKAITAKKAQVRELRRKVRRDREASKSAS